MSVRRSLAAMPAEFRFLLTGAAAAGLLASCGMPQPVEPPPPPMAEMEAPPELYGAPPSDMAPMDQPGDVYAQAEPGGQPNPYADAEPAMEPEARRPGWGTMEPIPNPPGSAPSGRAYARAESAPRADAMGAPSEPALPEARERLGAYSAVGPASGSTYARQVPPPPPPYETPQSAPYQSAPYAQGAPAASFPPVVVTMRPVPNPADRRSAPRSATAPEPRVRHAVAPRPESRRTARAAADQKLMGGPAKAQRSTARAAAASAEGASRAAAATVREPAKATQRAERNRPAAAGAAAAGRQTAAKLPPASTPAGRAARLKRLEGSLAQLVQRDSTLTVPEKVEPGRTERITLTLPQGLSETLTREARANGLRELASKAELSTTLEGDGWRVEPEEPQTDEIRAGRVSSFTWRATPDRGAGPLTADVDARLSGGGRFETLQLGELTREVESAGANALSGGGLGGLGWRTIGAALLLLALLIGALFYARRRDDDGVGDGSRRRFNRRRPDPVNLTPYSPSADTDAPIGPRGDDGLEPEPGRP